MACYHPLKAYRHALHSLPGQNLSGISFHPVSANIPGVEKLSLPCGQCIGCRLKRSLDWAVRIVLEKSLHERSCFITLTYDDVHLPKNGSLQQKDVTDFLKRLRKKIGSFRYFYCGEYGANFKRPHYHLCLFGHDFPDRVLYKRSRGGLLYTSKTLETCWKNGYCPFGELTFESAAYTARYILKKQTGNSAAEHYGGRTPEFICMSRNPGLASDWFAKYSGDVYPKDYIMVRRGLKSRPPRYFDKLFYHYHADELYAVKEKRIEEAKKHELDNSPERLLEREKVVTYNQKLLLTRDYENEVV